MLPTKPMSEDNQQQLVGTIFNDDQVQHITDILNARVDDIEMVKLLKEYLEQFRSELEARGYEPTYLAYALMHAGNEERRRINKNQ